MTALPRTLFRNLSFASLMLCAGVAGSTNVDLVIAADYVVTMDDNNTLIENGAIAINRGEIVAVGRETDILRSFPPKELINGAGRALMPGLINGHTHAAMTLFRGIADDLPLMDWLNKYIFPAEIRFVDPHFVRVGTQLACLEMIKGGTTTFVDMYFYPGETAKIVDACGLRAVIGAAVIEQKSGYTRDFADAMAKAEAFIGRWQGKNPRITPAFAAHSAYTITPKNLKYIRERARVLDVPVTIHLAESKAELEIVKRLYGETSIDLLESINFFSGPTIAAHVVWPDKDEIPILVKRHVGVIHNPTSNLKIAAGIAPIPELLAAGVSVGLGTDGAASNNDLDMWEEIRLAALIHKGRLLNPKVMPAATVLGIATRGGAEAIGLGGAVGSLTPGRRADLIQISLRAPHLVPLYNIISHLVYVVDAEDVQTVIVDGHILMRDRKVLTLDEAAVIKSAEEIAARIEREIHPGKQITH